MQKAITDSDTYKYLLFLPNNYGTSGKWPAILFLHGVGGNGSYLEILKANGLPKLLEEHEEFPFIVISPQCPEGEDWSPEKLGKLIDRAVQDYRIDTDRIYLTGIHTGGSAAWDLAMAQPDRFAAIAPVCGGGKPQEVCYLRDIPVWIFHAAGDRIVPVSEAQSLVLALKLCGGNVTSTFYPQSDFEYLTAIYENPGLYAWFLQHSKSGFHEPAFDPVAEDLD